MNRVELVQKKFPDHVEAALAIEDLSQGNNKYLLWIAKQLSLGHNSSDITASLKFFHENPARFKQKDIMKYKDLKNLEDIIKEMGLSKRQEKEKDKEGAFKIFEDENFLVVRVDDKPAMIAYGANTKWCTTMKDQTYYEDYVSQGNDFYIVITKNKKAAKSSKYAIVRKGLLDFRVYDDQDTSSRLFDDDEIELLREAVKAIVSDKPPKNYFRQVCNGQIPAADAADWVEQQTEVTKKFIKEKRPDLQFINKSTQELADIFINDWDRRHMVGLGEQIMRNIAEFVVQSNDPKYHKLKVYLLEVLKGQDLMILAKDKDARIRSRLVVHVSEETAKEFFGDKAVSVLKAAARKVDKDFLFSSLSTVKSTRMKKALQEIIIERISQEKVRRFVLNQPLDVLKTLLEF